MNKKQNIITIDFGIWETQKHMAERKKASLALISKRIKRGNIDSWHIKQLGVTLVRENPSLYMLSKSKKKVINIVTGVIYNSVREASNDIGLRVPILIDMLKGRRENNTNLKYY